MMERLRRTLFTLSADYPASTRRARLRALWHTVVLGYAYEICHDCGARVGPHTGSYWSAPDEMWRFVVGSRTAVLCPPCFTTRAQEIGLSVYWTPQLEAEGIAPQYRFEDAA